MSALLIQRAVQQHILRNLAHFVCRGKDAVSGKDSPFQSANGHSEFPLLLLSVSSRF